MSIVIDRANANKVVERTEVLIQTPYRADITEALGIFTPVYTSQKHIEIVRQTNDNQILVDNNWEERPQTLVGGERSYLNLRIPHFAVTDAIYPQDIDGILSASDVATEGLVNIAQVGEIRAEKMMRIRQAFADTEAQARFQLLSEGTVYAPRGTMRTSYGDTVNYYTEFGVARQSIPFDLAGTADPREDARALLKAVREGSRGATGSVRQVVVLCGGEFFTALLKNPFVTDAVKYVQLAGGQSLATLLGVNTEDPRFAGIEGSYPSISLWGLTFIDVSYAGMDVNGSFVPFIADDEAVALPIGLTNLAKTYYAPANLFSAVNKRSQGSYWFEEADNRRIKIDAEQNFMNGLLYPAAIVGVTLA